MGGVGGGSGTGGGSGGGINVVVFPPTATLTAGENLLMVARVDGTANQTVIWGLDNGVGSVNARGDGAAYFYSSSTGNAVVRATSAAMGSASTTVPITIDDYGNGFEVIPRGPSETAYVLGPSQGQSFAAVDYYSSAPAFAGIASAVWSVGPSGSIGSDGALTTSSQAGTYVVYAVDPQQNNHVKWSEVDVSNGGGPAVKVTPTLSTVNAGSSQQLTATVTPSANVLWNMVSQGSGASVSSQGLFTASLPGVYVIKAYVTGNPDHFGVATVVVQ
jgi:hypothetical protein